MREERKKLKEDLAIRSEDFKFSLVLEGHSHNSVFHCETSGALMLLYFVCSFKSEKKKKREKKKKGSKQTKMKKLKEEEKREM